VSDGMIAIFVSGKWGRNGYAMGLGGVAGEWLVNVEREGVGTCVACLGDGEAGLEGLR
jgi:hypothetical protein